MMKQLKFVLAGIAMIASLSFTTTMVLPSSTASAACNDTVLTFPAWYKGLQDSDCNFKPKVATADKGDLKKGDTDFQTTVVIIVLNVANIILQLVGYAAAVMLIVGGFKYMTAQGESDKMAAAKKTILNSIIGLVVSIMAAAIVNLIVKAF